MAKIKRVNLQGWAILPAEFGRKLFNKMNLRKPVGIAIVTIIAIIALALLLMFSERLLVGKAFTTGQVNAGLEDQTVGVNQPFNLPVKANIGTDKSVAFYFALRIPSTLSCSDFGSLTTPLNWKPENGAIITLLECNDQSGVIKMQYATINADSAVGGNGQDFILANIPVNGLVGENYQFDFADFKIYKLGTAKDAAEIISSGGSATITVTTFACTGGDPAHAVICSGDAQVTTNTPKRLVAACTPAKCEYVCGDGYELNAAGSACISGAVCDATHLNLCITEASCTVANGYWDGYLCIGRGEEGADCTEDVACQEGLVCDLDQEACVVPVVAVCDATHLNLCTTEVTCTGAGGFWNGQACVAKVAAGGACTVDAACQSGLTCQNNGCVIPAACGDGTIDTGEQCDDGDNAVGDGCDEQCRVECLDDVDCDVGYECDTTVGYCVVLPGCSAESRLVCTTEADCENSAKGAGEWVCANNVCQCLAVDGETCSRNSECASGQCLSNVCTTPVCAPATRQYCMAADCATLGQGFWDTSLTPDQCVAPLACGNGALDANEQCDDRNRNSGDGCDDSCQLEGTHDCSRVGQVCTALSNLFITRITATKDFLTPITVYTLLLMEDDKVLVLKSEEVRPLKIGQHYDAVVNYPYALFVKKKLVVVEDKPLDQGSVIHGQLDEPVNAIKLTATSGEGITLITRTS